MITGRELINGYYEDTKLYSTGDEDLDDLLERAFCEGYEYAQREFSYVDNKGNLVYGNGRVITAAQLSRQEDLFHLRRQPKLL